MTSIQDSGKNDEFQRAQDTPVVVQQSTTSMPFKSEDSKLIAIIAMNIAALSTTAMTASFRVIAEQGFHPADFNLFRNILSLVISYIWCLTLGYNPIKMFPWEQKGTMLTRCISGQSNFLLLGIAAPLAPLALIMVFWQTSPFWISIVAFFLMREPIIALELVSMVVCFSAVVVIATQQLQDETMADSGEIQDGDSSNFIGLMCALVAGVVMAFCAVSTRMLKEHPLPIIIFYHTLGGLIATGIFIGVECAITGNGTRLTEYTGKQFLICLAACFCDAGALFGVTLAYQKDSSGFVALISYMNIVYAYICDQIFFNEQLNTIELVAALVILIIALGVAVYKLQQQAQARKLKQEKAQPLIDDKKDAPFLKQGEQ